MQAELEPLMCAPHSSYLATIALRERGTLRLSLRSLAQNQGFLRLGEEAGGTDGPESTARCNCDTMETVVGSLTNIANLVDRRCLRAPAVIVIGEVVRLHDELQWFGKNFWKEAEQEVAALVAA